MYVDLGVPRVLRGSVFYDATSVPLPYRLVFDELPDDRVEIAIDAEAEA
jgi:hypothetical protein